MENEEIRPQKIQTVMQLNQKLLWTPYVLQNAKFLYAYRKKIAYITVSGQHLLKILTWEFLTKSENSIKYVKIKIKISMKTHGGI
jgi:hypothetical protein